jgi:hypothetical protein
VLLLAPISSYFLNPQGLHAPSQKFGGPKNLTHYPMIQYTLFGGKIYFGGIMDGVIMIGIKNCLGLAKEAIIMSEWAIYGLWASLGM